MCETCPSLLVTKLYVPNLRFSYISSPHLLALLDAGAERKLILIAAAAGFDKTSVMAEWSGQCWVSWQAMAAKLSNLRYRLGRWPSCGGTGFSRTYFLNECYLAKRLLVRPTWQQIVALIITDWDALSAVN